MIIGAFVKGLVVVSCGPFGLKLFGSLPEIRKSTLHQCWTLIRVVTLLILLDKSRTLRGGVSYLSKDAAVGVNQSTDAKLRLKHRSLLKPGNSAITT